jgi:hypothetical protein
VADAVATQDTVAPIIAAVRRVAAQCWERRRKSSLCACGISNSATGLDLGFYPVGLEYKIGVMTCIFP